MRAEWKEYLQSWKRSALYSVAALGVSLLFFAASLPTLKPEERLQAFFQNMGVSVAIALLISVFFGIAGLYQTRRHLRTGVRPELSRAFSFSPVFLGVIIGLYPLSGRKRGHLKLRTSEKNAIFRP